MTDYKSYFREIRPYEIYFCEDCKYYKDGECFVNKDNFLLKYFHKKVKSNSHICCNFIRRG